jgi:hypothetical protein
MGGWEVRYHIADYVEKNKNGGRFKHNVIAYTCKYLNISVVSAVCKY